jgi:HSP20 family protein
MTFYLQSYPFHAASRRFALQSRPGALGVNLREQDDAYILSAPVPGLKAEDLTIQVLEDVVSIEGRYEPEQADYLLNELPAGSFRRSLRLPTAIEAEQVEAKIVDGMLTLSLPKAESARPRKIQVSVN